jgi:hypothetical protein
MENFNVNQALPVASYIWQNQQTTYITSKTVLYTQHWNTEQVLFGILCSFDRVILNLILKKQSRREWTGIIWLRIWASDVLIYTVMNLHGPWKRGIFGYAGTMLPIPVAARSKVVGLRPLGCWDRGFESRWGHECLSLVFICCVVLCR